VRIAALTGLFPILWETPFLNQITGLVELAHEVGIYADQPQPEATGFERWLFEPTSGYRW